MKTKTPEEYFKAYLHQVFGGADLPLPKTEYIEVGCAFYAGVEAVYKFFDEHINDSDEADEIGAARIAKFRRQNKDCAMHINLTRFGETHEKPKIILPAVDPLDDHTY